MSDAIGKNGRTHMALPLKYRPMTFEDVVGQEHVVRTLRHAIETGHVANAYLFIGSRGIGKTTMSRIFAKALNCANPRNGVEPCGECENCRQIAEGRSIDVTELDGASHNKVDDVKPIIEAVQFAPTSSKYKIFIIDECHMLSVAAWNALLKTLEEPPPYVKFIFATTEGDKVLATIVSRCQRFDLRRILTHQIVSRLRYICDLEKVEIDNDALLAIARGAEGGMRDALSSLDQLIAFKGGKITEEDALNVFGLVSRRALEDLAGAVFTGDHATILKSVDTFDSAGKNMRRLAGEILSHVRNLIVYQSLGGKSSALEASEDQLATLEVQSKMVEPARLFRIADELVELDAKLSRALSVRTLLELSLIRASRIATTASIEELMRALKALKSASPSMPAVAVTESLPTPPVPTPPPASTPAKVKPAHTPAVVSAAKKDKDDGALKMTREELLNDPKLNELMGMLPKGSKITDIKEAR